jgi:hypothetical protein
VLGADSQPARIKAMVDEPEGARYSLGQTLWHLGHQADQVARFHEFLKIRGKSPVDLLPASRRQTPDKIQRLLLEPELLPASQRNGWSVEKDFLTSGATDAGPTVNLPLTVRRSGAYRLWVQYYGSPAGTGVTRLQIASKVPGKNPAPLVVDEIYDDFADKEGLHWKDILVDLPSGEYVVSLGHVTVWWQNGKRPKGYMPRKIDCLFLTEELWAPAPSMTLLNAMRRLPRQGIQFNEAHPLPRQEQERWRAWQVRPVSWEDREKQPALFALSREFWRAEFEELSKKTYDEKNPPDYRRPERQVVFDDRSNMLANPVRIERQSHELEADVSRKPLGYNSYWLPAANFHFKKGWYKEGEGDSVTLAGSYGDFNDVAQQELRVEKPGRYQVWVHYYNINYFAPWQGRVFVDGTKQLSYNHDKQLYPADWDRMGAIEVKRPGKIRIEVQPLPFRSPATYRRIYTFFLVDDANYKPQGSVRPPFTRETYSRQAAALGATAGHSLLHWCFEDPFTPLSQEVWSETSWPKRKVTAHESHKINMARDSVRSVQVGLRNLSDKPVVVQVKCGSLTGAGGSFPNAVNWRVVAFCPYGPTRQAWSPFMLLRRPDVTVPPYQPAAVWLTVDTRGVSPGDYTATIDLLDESKYSRTVTLHVRVSPVKINPREPVLVHGWTQPYDGDEYLQDFVDHGMNVWPGVMTVAEMRKWGIRLLALSQWSAEESAIREQFDKLRKGGVPYSDWMVGIRDEPGADTAEKLKDYIDVAKAVRRVDPRARICFNPSEAASLKTFQILEPLADFWLPYTLHLSPNYNGPEKKKIYTPKPWLWYTTPCNWDKSPELPHQMYSQIRSVAAQPGHCLGTAFFAFNYPWRDPWDTGYEHIVDASTTVLRSRHGPVPTRTWEAIREGTQHTNLAVMVREKLGKKTFDQITEPRLKKLVETGSVDELLEWLEKHP